MIKLNMHEAKTHLSRYIRKLKEGDSIIICRRNVPVAEVRAISAETMRPRPVGLDRGSFEIPPSFHEPLPDDALRAWSGEAE